MNTIDDDNGYIDDYIKDGIVHRVLKRFINRSNEGITKYGTTLYENEKDDFLTHLQEELMDAVLYIEKLKQQRDEQPR